MLWNESTGAKPSIDAFSGGAVMSSMKANLDSIINKPMKSHGKGQLMHPADRVLVAPPTSTILNSSSKLKLHGKLLHPSLAQVNTHSKPSTQLNVAKLIVAVNAEVDM